MRLSLLVLAMLATPLFAGTATFRLDGAAPAWTKILGSVGVTAATSADAQILIENSNSTADVQSLAASHIVVIEGVGPLAIAFGIVATDEKVPVRQIVDRHGPNTQIIWEHPETVAAVTLPSDFQIFASERWKNGPVLAGKRTAHGGILWLATAPGESGFERYPYVLQALVDLGLNLPLRSTTLWAFFDSSYRIRADVDYLAKRWRSSGVSVLHVAAWHNMEPDPIQDEYLKSLIAACHRHAILVYAWLELPHVSEKFWNDHPQWREKTAAGQDAQLDWRKLMNLQNPDCQQAVKNELVQLFSRFDWDGANLAELYFESLEGAANPARFTPMNDNVRAEFKEITGVDPRSLFDSKTAPNAKVLRQFLDFRAVLASRLQSEWLQNMDVIRKSKPYLDVVLTHIDDRFDPGIRDELGADVARTLPLTQSRNSTLLVEDPATLWDLGPERYKKLAAKYRTLDPSLKNVAIDINIVDRYQDVYPTKKQTGVELFELVHQATASFGRVALYFENSLEKQDLPLLSASATTATALDNGPDEMEVKASEPIRVAWQGPVEIDGHLWPIQNADTVLTPAGTHRLSPAVNRPSIAIADFNGDVESVSASALRVELSYRSRSRAIASLASSVTAIDVDGAPFWKTDSSAKTDSFLLPAGQHVVTFRR